MASYGGGLLVEEKSSDGLRRLVVEVEVGGRATRRPLGIKAQLPLGGLSEGLTRALLFTLA